MSQLLPLVSREWRNGNYYKYHVLPFFHSLRTKGRNSAWRWEAGSAGIGEAYTADKGLGLKN